MKNTVQQQPERQNEPDMVTITVTDTGPAISKEDQEKVFGDGVGFAAGVLGATEGIGIRLWISRRFMLLHKGSLSVSSASLSPSLSPSSHVPPPIQPAEHALTTATATTQNPSPAASLNAQSNNCTPNTSITPIGSTFTMMLPAIMRSDKFKAKAYAPGYAESQNVSQIEPSRGGGLSLISRYDRGKPPTVFRPASPRPMSQSSQSVIVMSHSQSQSTAGRSPRFSSSSNIGRLGLQEQKLREPLSPKSPFRNQRMPNVSSMVQAFDTVPSNVLVVDDAPMNRKMMCRLLEGHCESTTTAEDGADAVNKMKKAIREGSPYVLVLMDYQMPKLDGPNAANLMREAGYNGPIIGVTGNTLQEQDEEYLNKGADIVLHKPLDYEDLLNSLSDMGFEDILT
eukprot:CAMPEP_0182424062 /NCGR_PEP_ID=MMETSP1167-20130531/10160_1 /TAXON_ID=2988 /ORGANISM="Mallomonas Sp, Strain CCMP3275" /LENGTH=396 /DNA_ID=CAMNT_0024603577 /DNA_START=934 /DNA_END=2124 /DNA_ORIENTATION=+